MHFKKTVFFCFVMISSNIVAFADKEDRSEEVMVLEDQDIKADNETSAEAGPPDSHEAMNNRDINPKIREKRSYEFLMGLINNNSRYEVTKVDPSVVTAKPKEETENVAASELLLELMVRIAAHPNQWDKVHTLLQNIDRDLTTSRNIVKNLTIKPDLLDTPNTTQNSTGEIFVDKKQAAYTDSSREAQLSKEKFSEKDNSTNKFDEVYDKELKWPTFEDEERESNVKFVNDNSTEMYADKNIEIQKYSWQIQNKSTKSTYPKNFSYHRVTGKPIYLNKNPKAYIAVSVIAPKPINTRSQGDDATLEKELRQLKPWTHTQNLKNMATIRSRWLIQADNKTKSVVPTL